MEHYDFLIIGNSVGAVGCIETLRTLEKKKTVAVVDEEPYHVYSRALLPYYLDREIPLEKMYYRPADFYRRMGVTAILGRRAVGLDVERKIVHLDDGRALGYGKLLLATGRRPIVPPVADLDLARENVCTFPNLQDAQRLARFLGRERRAVVMGGGIIGLMTAEALCKKGLSVGMVELAPRVLAPVVDEVTKPPREGPTLKGAVEKQATMEKIE